MQSQLYRYRLPLLFCLLALLSGFSLVNSFRRRPSPPPFLPLVQIAKTGSPISPSVLISPSSTPTPTVKVLSFADMNAAYGPCTATPVLYFHHIQDLALAKKEGHSSLTVSPDYFAKDMEYLANHSYHPITPAQLIAFFTSGTALPSKSIMLTFDDAYDDFASDAAPVLSRFNYPAVMFVPTGLVNNPGYLSWSQITDLQSRIYFGNHTWSHKSSAGPPAQVEQEISLADTQLSDRGLNSNKIFAYPYGTVSNYAASWLRHLGYNLAFTTHRGSILCARQSLTLPRIGIGNAPLSAYGL